MASNVNGWRDAAYFWDRKWRIELRRVRDGLNCRLIRSQRTDDGARVIVPSQIALGAETAGLLKMAGPIPGLAQKRGLERRRSASFLC